VILVDTSVWIEHIRKPNAALEIFLEARDILVHPFVIGEVALGHVRTRDMVLAELDLLPRVVIASAQEVLHLISRERLFGLGIGYVDAHLLASASITDNTRLWTFDRNLHGTAARLGLAHVSPG
jgi:predicted nucleic acid-binding protein